MNGQELKEQGQDLALEHAGQDWQQQALEYLQQYVAIKRAEPFAIEDFRAFAVTRGLPQPATHKAWGAFPRLAVKRGLIRSTETYRKARSPRTHAHPVLLWVAA
ncbi:MAG: hypothetical protein ABFE08_01155 [Armatimonadia bacterium]